MVTVHPVDPRDKAPTPVLSNEAIAKGITSPEQDRIKAINLLVESNDSKVYGTLLSCMFDGVSSDVRTAAIRGLQTLREKGVEPPSGIDILKALKIARRDSSPSGGEADNVYGFWLKKNRELGIASVVETKPGSTSPADEAAKQRKATQSKKPQSTP